MSISKKVKVIIVAMSVSFPNEKGAASRFYSMADTLKNAGYDVLLITGSFNHGQKCQRDEKSIECEFDYKIVHQPSYKSNISIRRVASLVIFRRNVQKLIADLEGDVLISTIPDNFTTVKIFKQAKKKGWNKILDIEDLWPEVMEMYLDTKKIGMLKPLLFPYRISAWQAYKYADAYVGTSIEYTRYGIRYDKRNARKPQKTVFVGNNIALFDKGVRDNRKKIYEKTGFWVTYAGTIGVSYDIKTIIDSAILLKKNGYEDIYFKILGDGETKDDMEEYAALYDCNVEFFGFQPYEVMAAYLAASDIVVNSFVKDAPQSIVTKIGDYLASGRPMINTCSSIEMRHLVDHYKVGVNVEAEDDEILEKAIIDLYESPEKRKVLGDNARVLAERKFDRKKAYKEVVNLIEEVRALK